MQRSIFTILNQVVLSTVLCFRLLQTSLVSLSPRRKFMCSLVNAWESCSCSFRGRLSWTFMIMTFCACWQTQLSYSLLHDNDILCMLTNTTVDSLPHDNDILCMHVDKHNYPIYCRCQYCNMLDRYFLWRCNIFSTLQCNMVKKNHSTSILWSHKTMLCEQLWIQWWAPMVSR